MKKTETTRFDALYKRHLKLLKLQGKSKGTIDNYARAVRRISQYFDCCPDKLTPDQLEDYFNQFLDTHSWSTVKVERNGLQFLGLRLSEALSLQVRDIDADLKRVHIRYGKGLKDRFVPLPEGVFNILCHRF